MKNYEEQRILKFQIQHELIGNHSFQITEKCHMSQLRLHIIQNSPLCLYQNFNFQAQGKQIYEYHQELSELFKTDTQLNVIFHPFDYYSSKHHEEKVKQILANPIQWAIVNSRESNWKAFQQESQITAPLLDQIFQNPFTSELSQSLQKKETDFVGMINTSGFNPTPSYRKHQGDFYYIQIKTLQETDVHATANSEGFFVNQSTLGNFNPNPNTKYTPCISLLDLLYQVSPKFKLKFQQTIKKAKISQFQRIILNYQPIVDNYVWLKDNSGWKRNNIWRNDCCSKQQHNQICFPAVKDWSMMFQFYRNAPSQSLLDKMNRQKLKYKTYQQLIQTALEGIKNIFNGTLPSMNQCSTFTQQIFYYEYLLFYFSNNQTNSILSSKYINQDIHNLALLENLQFEHLHLTNMIVVQYRGFQIIVKTVPNSIVNQDTHLASILQLLSIPAENNDQFTVSLKKICKQLNIESQNIYIDSDGKTSLTFHPQMKGLACKDNDKFIFDCSSFSPRDLNFTDSQEHSFLRPEIMKIYNSRQKCAIPYNTMIGTKYKVAPNEKIKLQEKKLKSVAKFGKEIMVGSIIDSFDEQTRKYLSDSKGITSILHKYGLSSKYLSLIYLKAVEKRSHHIRIMIERVILVKCVKIVLKKLLQQSPLHQQRQIIKNFMNSLFQNSDVDSSNKHTYEEDQDSPKKKKKKGKQNEIIFEINFKKTADKRIFTPSEQLWKQLTSISLAYFNHNLNDKTQIFKYQFSKSAILRDICLTLGIQLQKKQYFCKEGEIFSEQNIVCMVPKVNIILSQPKELSDLIQQGDILASKYQLEEAFQKYNRALQYLFVSFNGVHEKLALINKKIAAIYYKVGDFDTAIISAQTSCQIYEYLLGPEHVETIQTYLMIGVYQFARRKFNAAEAYILKAIYLAKFAYSQCYPQLLLMYLNLSTVYETQKKYPDAIMSIFFALHSSIKIFGQWHVHTAIIYSALASLHYQIPDIDQCIRFQTKTIQILQRQLGIQDERVTEAKNACQGYKNMQNSKKVKQLHDKEQKNIGFPSSSKINFKPPFYDLKERPSDFIWKKNKKMRYFF